MSKKDININHTDIERPEAVEGEVVNLKTDLPEAVREYAIKVLCVDDPCKLTQLQFNSALMYVYDRYIYNINLKENNRYIESVLYDIYKVYVNLCSMYDKHICVNGFSLLTDIDRQVIYEWRDIKKASSALSDIAKKLINDSEESLQDLLVTGKRNPVGIVAILNNRHGWASQTIKHEHTASIQNNGDIAGLLGVKT